MHQQSYLDVRIRNFLHLFTIWLTKCSNWIFELIIIIIVFILIYLVVLVQQLQLSRTCLTIFAVPSYAAFCKSSKLLFTCNFFGQSFSLFDVIPRAPITTGTITNWEKFQIFSFPILVAVIVYIFLFFQLNQFVPRHSSINKVTLSFSFVQHNYIRSSVLNDVVCFDIKISQYFDPVILKYTCRFVIIPFNLTN